MGLGIGLGFGFGSGFGCNELAIVRERASLEGDKVAVIQLVASRHLLAVDQGQLSLVT